MRFRGRRDQAISPLKRKAHATATIAIDRELSVYGPRLSTCTSYATRPRAMPAAAIPPSTAFEAMGGSSHLVGHLASGTTS